MSQVRIGTADVTNGSQVVSGSGTNWLSSVSANDLFIIQGESVIYRIASVASDTQLSLSSNYVGPTAAALPYVVHVDFTGSGIPLMQDGDIETVSIYNLAVVSLEQGLSFSTYYLGAFAVAPTATSTGGALTEGLMYFDTVTNRLNVYNGSAWYDSAVEAANAAQSAAEAAADAILTASDRVQTGLDRVQTGLDKDQTGLDRVQTGSDAAQTISDASQTAADRVQTGLDRVQTNLDVTQTILDAAQTASDRVQTGLDETQTGLDVIQTISDAAQTASDAVATAADRVQTGLDRIQTESDSDQTISDAAATAADRVQTGIDSTDTSADSVQTGLDRVQTIADAAQTALDRTQTGSDATQTAADRVQTGLDLDQTTIDSAQTTSDRVQTIADAVQTADDRVQTSADRVQTISDAASTAADRVYVDGVEANVLAVEVSINNTFDTFDDRFLGTFTTDPTHDNDGNAISVGAVYYNSVELATKFYNGSTWDDPSQSASTSATNALNSENAAAASETAAATSESNAATSESNAAASESAASTSEGNAATSASAASVAETSASNSATAAAASYDSFDDRYLGPKASEPTLDNDGNALLTGAIYWNTPESAMKVYTGSIWNPVTTFIEGIYEVTEFTSIAGQSTLTIEYDVGLAQVLYNGVQLNLSDFTATNGTTIVLATAVAHASDVITVMLWGAVTNSTLIGTAAGKDTGTAAGELPTNADLATGAFTTVGTAATVNTGVTTGTLPFAEDVVLIQPSGNVGIGIASPAKKLTVFGTGVGNATVQIEGEGGADPYINFLTNNAQHWSLGVDDSDADKFKISEHSALGTNDYLTVDVTGNVGIGTSSALATLSIKGTTNELDIETSATGVTLESIDRADSTKQSDMSFYARYGNHIFHSGAYTEKARLDSSGHFLVGKTAPDAAVAGSELKADGTAVFSRSSTSPTMYVSTLGSDGDLISFRKDSATVGSIGTYNGVPYYGGSGGGVMFNGSDWNPTNGTATRIDGVADLGASTYRFRNAYLSGGVVFGDAGSSGTSSSNTLDEYEEGTWVPTVQGSSTNPVINYGSREGTYTRVGSLVTAFFFFNVNYATSQGGGQLILSGLPFTVANNNTQQTAASMTQMGICNSSGTAFGRATPNTAGLRLGSYNTSGGYNLSNAGNMKAGYCVGKITYTAA